MPAPAKERVHRSARRVLIGWMHDQAGRLVEDEQILVFVHDVEAHVLGDHASDVRGRGHP